MSAISEAVQIDPIAALPPSRWARVAERSEYGLWSHLLGLAMRTQVGPDAA